MKFPESILSQHIAVLGKTGSGKTSTGKLIIEQVHAGDARVCILDPIKSDWWGLTSSSDGKRPGLPFDILGGPHGHVPLHAAAGAPVGQLVGSGALRHSIIDMADFMPGEHAKFFIAFAQALFKHAKGVLYLVVEEAHIFAPKEMAGFGEEAKSIHWMSKLATGARSKGLRLVVATQRTQKLHNDVLGSCDTMIVHRLTAPADQEPVIKWLKANTDPETTKTIAGSLSSLATGEGWICSGEAKILDRVKFPRIKTFDNTATPTGDGEDHKVRTAPVDQERLKSIIGDAVKEAEANDPKKLREQIAKLKRELDAASKGAKPAAAGKPVIDTAAIEKAVKKAVVDRDRFWMQRTTKAIRKINGMGQHLADYGKQIAEVQEDLKVDLTDPAFNQPQQAVIEARPMPATTARQALPKLAIIDDREPSNLTPTEQAVINAVAAFPSGATMRRISVYSGRSIKSSSFTGAFPALIRRGLLGKSGDRYLITDAGRELSQESAAVTLDDWLRKLTPSEANVLRAIVNAHPQRVTREDVSLATGQSIKSSSFTGAFPALRDLELIEGTNDFAPTEALMDAG